MKPRILNLNPAITNMPEAVLQIAGEQPKYYRTKEFVRNVQESRAILLKLVGCKNGKVAFLTSSGTGAMEAAVLNFIKQTDKVLIINGGMFGKRWVDICMTHSINFLEIKIPFGKSINLKKLKVNIALYRPTFVLMQACETSATQSLDVCGVGSICKFYGSKLIVDAISSFLVDPYFMTNWNVDVSILSSQKGLGLSTGLSMVVFKDLPIRPKSYYFDLSRYLDLSGDIGLPFTPNLIVLAQLNYQLKKIQMAGVGSRIDRVREIAKDFRYKIRNLPFTLMADNPASCATGLYTERTDVKAFFKYLVAKNIYFIPSGGSAGKKFIVGHLGEITKDDNTTLVKELKKWVL